MLLFSVSFFTLAPDLRRLAREKRNEKQRKKSLLMEAFFVPEIERLRPMNRCLHRHNEENHVTSRRAGCQCSGRH
ncbi:pheST operon leader peptide PheM [Salmonella enterica]|uniref:PheST operon leader peptide PheM n=1 Tax=Salmonella diarizonae TaxID=59204 RepID=A0A726Q7V5_SALDZ|nr:pheST operon leader peptide PheM [Salmonella enterica]HAB4585562.1 pheST operon leader peptide PheM [Salmonella enterica subsp. diarizonae]EAP5828649.1 pheST operon leader peptide PheM [Salmonella enterica]EAQ9442739.1 pheST operon leader peptide PheM [Salmonella enterica]EAR4764026.1 pheST operon leader peptide PheM [Salmonella enterica]